MKNGLIYGLIGGLIYLGWTIIGGNLFPSLVFSTIPAFTIHSLVAVIFMTLACRKEKSVLDGSIRFGEAFLVCLATYAVYNLIYSIGFKFYIESSPAAMETFIEVTKASTIELLTMAGTPEDQIFEAEENIQENIATMLTWKTTIINFFGTLLFPGAILALITAAITSKFSKKTTV